MLPFTLQFLIAMIGRTTVADILAKEGIEPAPEREKKRTWKQFLKTHWDSLYGCDFFCVEALGLGGTVRCTVFFVIALKTRAVEIAGIATNPDGRWMQQMARNLTDSVDGFLRRCLSGQYDHRNPLDIATFSSDPLSAQDGGGKVVCRSRLGGALNFYYREAA